jgi:DNA-binding transcriptional MerR regulator
MPATTRQTSKSAAAFRTISEVSTHLEVPQHVLRFWETKFIQVRPLKRGGGRRYYRPEDIELLRRIRDLLYTEGYTIKGVQRLLRDSAGRPDDGGPVAPSLKTWVSPGAEARSLAAQRTDLETLLGELIDLRELLRGAK